MAQVPQQLINGIAMGSVYILGALGLMLIFGVLDIPHFAHGQVYTIGAFSAYLLVAQVHLNLILAIIITLLICGLVGLAMERLVYNPLRSSPLLSVAIASFALALLIQYSSGTILGQMPKMVPTFLAGKVIEIGAVAISYTRILVFGAGIVAIVLLWLFIMRTKLGKAIRAMTQNRNAAELIGVDVSQLHIVTFMIGSTMAGVSGALLGLMIPIYPSMGMMPTMKGFVIITLGGMNILGAVVGGFILGISESIGAGFISSAYKDSIAFIILLAILMIRPTGLFGKRI